MHPLFHMIARFQIPFAKALQLFKAFIQPILLYNAENWSVLTDKQLPKCMSNSERLYEYALKSKTTVAQLKFFKYLLGLSRQAPTMAVLGEVAELPLSLEG